MKIKQTERVITYIEEFGSITQLEALKDLGIMRLASRISDLKRAGYPITSDVETVKNRYGEKSYIKRYRLAKGGGSNAVCEGKNSSNRPLQHLL